MNKTLRKAIIAGNWKMNKTRPEAKELLEAIKPLVANAEGNVEVIACVPFTNLETAVNATAGSNVKVGAENVHFEKSGAFTGEISADMLVELCVEYVVIGHSERRQYFGETDETVNKRTKAALAAGNTELAKKALAKKVKADEDTASYKEMYETISKQTADIKEQVETLKSKLDEAKSRQAMLIARSQMADTQKNLAKSVGGFDASSSTEKFNRMEEKIIRKEAEADAFADISDSLNGVDKDNFDELQTNAKVDDELRRLMAEMNGASAESEVKTEV